MWFENFATKRITTTGAEIHTVHGGSGPPLLLLHGYPQTHAMWHRVAPRLAEHFHVICPDLRGYGDSAKPPTTEDHAPYAKRAMAQDMVEVMAHLGYDTFAVAGHDRGGRVTHRLVLDHPECVTRACVMDIVPTWHLYRHTNQAMATAYYHWFFLIQRDGLPERMIGADPAYYLMEKLNRLSGPEAHFDDRAIAEYLRCFSKPETIHTTCEDYRAGASIDLEHDEASRDRKIPCPLLVLWGDQGYVHKNYDVLAVWREWAERVEGEALPCGHFLPEEAPEVVADKLLAFFQRN